MVSTKLCRTGVALLACTGMYLLPAAAQAAPWTLTDLNVGVNTGYERINNVGQIVGSNDANFGNDTFLYDKGVMTALGHLPTTAGDLASWGVHINDAGVIVGNSTYGDNQFATFTYKNGTMSLLSTSVTVVNGINKSGQVIGNQGGLGALINGSQVTTFGNPAGRTTPYAINDLGHAVGAYCGDCSTKQSMFLYSGGQVTDLGGAGTDWAFAVDINNQDQILGMRAVNSGAFSYNESFLYQNGTITNLSAIIGSQAFEASALNDQGQVVGVDRVSHHSYLYSKGQMIDLTPFGITAVSDINEMGQIVGHSTTTGNLAILDIGVAAVPEPATYAMLLAGLGLLAWKRRRQA